MNNDSHRVYHASARAEASMCKACETILDAYVEAELANTDVRQLYPETWRHLQTCKSCAAHHELLGKILNETSPQSLAGQPNPPSLELPSLPLRHWQSSNVANRPWHVYLRPQLLGEPFFLRFSLAPSYLEKFTRRSTTWATRSPSSLTSPNDPPGQVLLQEHITLYEQKLVAKIVACPLPQQSDFIHVKATLTSTKRLPAKLQATLHWGRLLRTCSVTAAGEADLGKIALNQTIPLPTEKSMFALTFEAPALTTPLTLD